MSANENYEVETFAVETSDGWILEMHRLYHLDFANQSRPPLLLLHGFMWSFEMFIASGEG